jgi:glycosyltransferase involved in cell wall biosynthesis
VRVLLINGRPDAQENLGGDTIQLIKTMAALQELGLTVETCPIHKLDNLPAYDIAHVFNIQMPESSLVVFEVLQEKNIPIVLSSIYWDMFDQWYEDASTQRALWHWFTRLLGKSRAGRLYIAWQRQKSPRSTRWQTQRSLLAQATRILPNSQAEADLLQSTFRFGDDFQQKIDVIPNAIDLSLYRELPEPDQKFLQKYGVQDFVLEVGAIYSTKNQLGLIEALFNLPVPLVFVGQARESEPDYMRACQTRAKERGNVIFIDRVDHNELPGIYALAAVHALPSWRETPGLVSLEAAAAGCRIVTTSIGSTRDYFGDQAWYCYPGDRNSIRLAVEAALQASPSTTLRRRVLNEYSWQRAAEATLASYQKVLHQVGEIEVSYS